MGLTGPRRNPHPVRHGWRTTSDAWEINEGFAAQVLGCVRLEDEAYRREQLGADGVLGTLDQGS